LEDFKEFLQYDKLSKLPMLLDSMNPKAVVARRRKEEEVLKL